MFRHRIFSQEYWEKNKDSIKKFAKEYEKYEILEPLPDQKLESLEPELRPEKKAIVVIEPKKHCRS